MNDYSLSALLKKYNLRPRKGLAQNFLIDPTYLNKIVEAAELTPEDIILEIGPGPGTLTYRLAQAAGQVIAVELDPNMVNLLQNELGHLPNLTIVQADILQIQPAALLSNHQLPITNYQSPKDISQPPPSTLPPFHPSSRRPPMGTLPPYKVVANLPYYITSAVLRHLLEATPRPTRLVITIQKEVAQRITAKPGQMSLLAVSVQFYGKPKLVVSIPAGAFYPPPQVDSAVVRIDSYASLPWPVKDIGHFFQVVKAGFSQKRKQLKNTLASGLDKPVAEVAAALEKTGLDPARRAQTLSLEEWSRLAELL